MTYVDGSLMQTFIMQITMVKLQILIRKQHLTTSKFAFHILYPVNFKSNHGYFETCRWSRIARKLPGRTDNEIKNYWRTLMRKKAQEKKRGEAASSSPTPSSVDSSISSNNHAVDPHASKKAGEESFYDTGGHGVTASTQDQGQKGEQGLFSMDDIWKDIDNMSEENNTTLQPVSVYDGHSEEGCNFSCPPQVPSPSSWEYSSSDPLWVMDEESLFCPLSEEPYFSCYAQGTVFLTG